MSLPVKPIFLLADSQLLFWRPAGAGISFLERVRVEIDSPSPKAAYVGASNGDDPQFFDLFESAMATIDVTDCRMIPSEPSAEDWAFFDEADLVLLAGGDVARGWRAFQASGLKDRLAERYYGGAVLLGVSAGAVQLGLHGFREKEPGGEVRLFDTWKLVPAMVDVHAEPDWERLHRCLAAAEDNVRGIGIPSGGGAILYQDLSLEPVRRSLVELAPKPQSEDGGEDGGELQSSLLFPPEGGLDVALIESTDDDGDERLIS